MADPRTYSTGSGGGGTGLSPEEQAYIDSGQAEARANGGHDNIFDAGGLLGGWSGQDSALQQAQTQRLADERMSWWQRLHPPTAADLAPQYDYDPAGREAQMQALGQLQQWGRGGLTDTDRGMMEATRRRDEQGASAQRGAIQQQSQARGMGGSGLDYATQMQASQLGQQQASDAETQMMQSAQQRALSAVQASGQLGGQVRQMGQHETERQQDANSAAVQQAYEDATSRAAGANNAQTGQQQATTANNQMQRQQEQDQQNGIGTALTSILAAI